MTQPFEPASPDGTALMAKAITYYSDFLTGNRLLTSLKHCCSLPGDVDQRVWTFFDPVAMSAVIIVGVVCAYNSNLACKINQGLLLVNFITVIVTIVFNMAEGSSDSWYSPSGNESIFFPEDYKGRGVFQASGIYMHVFLTLATTATLATQHRGATHSTAISMIVTAIVAIIAIIKAASVSLLQPYDELDKFTPVATFMENVSDHDFHWVANVNCLGAIVASTAGILSMLVLSANTLEQMVSDGLLWSKLAARRPAISPATTTVVTTVVSAIGAAFQDYEGLILCLSSGTFLVFQAILIAVMVSRSHASRETALLIVLKFTWLLYFFVSPALVIITTHYGEVQAQSAVQGILAGVVLLFLQLAINWRQLGVKVVVIQVGTSLVMGVSSFLMYQLDELAWFRLYIWTFIGVMIYTLYGYRKSHLGRGIVDLAVVPEEECIRSLEEGLDNAGFQHELADLGIGRLRRTQRSIGGHSYASARSRHKESFHSAKEEDPGRQSFRSVKDEDERRVSFKSFTESFKSSRQPSLAVQSISSDDPSPGSQRKVRDVPDGRSSAAETMKRQGANRDSFRSIRSDVSKNSFKSVRSDDERGSFRGAIPGGRRSRFTSDSWKSASSGDSQRSTRSSRRQPGAARRASPPDAGRTIRQTHVPTISARTAPAALTHTPSTSRRATPADLKRTPPSSRRNTTADVTHTPPSSRRNTTADVTHTPPSSRRNTTADVTRTPPQSARGRGKVDSLANLETPRGRGQVEILINPRLFFEETYQASGPPPRTSAAPAALASRPGPSGTPDGGPPWKTVKTTSQAKDDKHLERNPDRHRADDSGSSSSSDSGSDSESAERRRYSDADIEAASALSTGSSRRSVSSDSSRDGPRTTRMLTGAAAASQSRLTDLGLGDFAPVPRGKRSLSMSDISYDDDESDSTPTLKPRYRRPGKGKAKQPPAHAVKEERLGSSHSPETIDDNIPRVHCNSPGTNNIDILEQSSPKTTTHTQSPLHQILPCVQRTGDTDPSTMRGSEAYASTDPDTMFTNVTSEDQRDCLSLQKVNDETCKISKNEPDIHATPTTEDMIIQDLEEQMCDSGFHTKQEQMSRNSSENSEERHPSVPATQKHDTEPAKNEYNDRDSSKSFESDGSSLGDKSSDREQPNNEKTHRNSSPSESDGGGLEPRTPKENVNKSFSDNAYSDEAGNRSQSGSEDSAVAMEGPPVLTHLEHPDESGSQSESADDTDTSSDSDRDSLPLRPASVATVLSEPFSDLNSGEKVDAPASLVDEEPTGEPGDLRPVLRRQMRLPWVPTEARWLARTPTPPGLLTSLGVTDGPRLALGRSASLPDLSSSSQSGDESDEESQARHRRPESGSDNEDSNTGSVKAQSLPDVGDSAAREGESIVLYRGSEQYPESSDSSEGSPVPQTRPEPVGEKKKDEEHSPVKERRQESESDNESSGVSSPGPLRRPRQVSESSEDGSPVPLRRKKDPLPRLATVTDRAMSLKGTPQPRSPASRLGSLPPLNPEYRAIYRPAEQPSYAMGAGRWQTAVQQARETFVHDAEGDDERAVSFVAAPLEQPRLTVESGGLQVRPELELVSRRLGGAKAAQVRAPNVLKTTPIAAQTTATTPTTAPTASSLSPGLTSGRKHSSSGQDGSPDVIYC